MKIVPKTNSVNGAKRVALNVTATYGRSLLALFCGLFTARWVLAALGVEGYGLWGLLVGMTGIVSIVNTLLSAAVGRFLAVAIGKGRGADEWFWTGTVLLAAVGTGMLAAGYPLGAYAIGHWITVPDGYVDASLWAWRWCCVACWIGMVTASWNAMYTAKQMIAELTVYSLFTTVANVAIAAWMVAHPGDWLSRYSFALLVVSVVPQMLIVIQATRKFEECRLGGLGGTRGLQGRAWEILRYAGWNSVSTLGWLLSNNGMAILVNKAFGPVANGAFALSNSVKVHAGTLATAMQGAFCPVVASAWGAGDLSRVRQLAQDIGRFSLATTLVFAVPLALEIDSVLALWLKTPPTGTAMLCLYALAILVANSFTEGLRQAVYASGNLRRFTIWCDSLFLFVLPVAAILCVLGCGLWVAGAVYLGATAINVFLRVWFAREVIGTSVREWTWRLALPGLSLAIVTCAAGLLPRLWMGVSLQRVIVTILFCEIVFLPLAVCWTGLGRWLARLRWRHKSDNGNGFRRHPVVMTVYDRAETLSRSLRNLSLCEGLGNRAVWLFVDQLREGGHATSVIVVAESFCERIPGLKIVQRDRNYGVPGNLVSGITEVVNREGAAIVFEDDVLVSRTFLSYMDEALTQYADNKRIWCVNGFHHPLVMKSLFDRADRLYLSPRNMAWGFGVWADRWNAVDFDMTNWELLRDDLNRAGRDIISLIEKQLRGDIHTWDVQCTVHMVKHGLMSVEPRRSLTKNIGFLGGFHKVMVNSILVHMPYYNLRPICDTHVSADPRMLRKMEWMTFDPRFRVRVWRKFRRGLARLMPLNEEPIE